MIPLALALVLAQPSTTAGRVTRAGTGLQLSGGAVSCKLAANGTVGCLNSISGQSQTLNGYQHWLGLQFFEDSYVSSSFYNVPVGIYVVSGGIGASDIVPPSPGRVTLYGRSGWGDDVAGVRVLTQNWRDGGYLFGVTQPRQAGSDSLVWGIAENGSMHMLNAIDRLGASDQSGGGIWDDRTTSGLHALDRADGLYLAIAGANGAEGYYVEIDGGRPSCDGGAWTHTQADGGCVYNYAGEHGSVNLADRYAVQAGYLAEIYNPLSGVGARTDHRAIWNRDGAYSQGHGLNRSQFPTPVAVDIPVYPSGTFLFGTQPGALYWDGPKGNAITVGSQRWYYAEPLVDAGAQWAKLEHNHVEAWVPVITASTTPTDGASLGKSCFDPNDQRAVPSVHLTISSAASGASSNLTIRGTNGAGDACDVAFACNTAAGTYVKTASGNGCSLVWGDCLTWVAQSKGGCSSWPTFTGFTPLTQVQ